MKSALKVLLILIVWAMGIYVGIKVIGTEWIKNEIISSRVFITGNLHGEMEIDKLNIENFPAQKELIENDNLIILGDFGLIWNKNIKDEMILDELDGKMYNILFVDGAHENFDLLYDYEVVTKYGGRVHKIRDNIFHLIRGEMYTISGKKYLVFGGGESEDKEFREEGVSYWLEEIPTKKDWDNLYANLDKNNYYVDYVLTYSPPSRDLKIIGASLGKNLGSGNKLNNSLQELSNNIKYKKWYSSYYHIDLKISRKNISIYDKIVELN